MTSSAILSSLRTWLAVFCFALWAYRTEAKLETPPDSFLLVSPDQTRCLVMWQTRDTNWGPDPSRYAILPDGRRLDLHTQFPSNGVYRLPDLKPVYFLDWFDGSNAVAVSSDLMAVAHIRDWAVDTYRVRPGFRMPKAMEFYKVGKLVRSYAASELVENPGRGGSFHTLKWQGDPNWVAYAPWPASISTINGSKVEVVTVPRGLFLNENGPTLFPGNRFIFDLFSGQILLEEHPMRHRSRVVVAIMLGLGLLIAGWFLIRKRQTS